MCHIPPSQKIFRIYYFVIIDKITSLANKLCRIDCFYSNSKFISFFDMNSISFGHLPKKEPAKFKSCCQ